MLDKEKLRIIFFGTPEFAVATLQNIIDNGYNVVAVVTSPDSYKGHSKFKVYSPVKELAISKNIDVLQPDNLNDFVFIETLRSYKANLQVVVAFKMLPKIIWNMPIYGTFNIHAALLPNYRGAAPINWAIINGEKKTGITSFFLDDNMDTGNIILQKEYSIQDNEYLDSVYNNLMKLGAQCALETLNYIIKCNGIPATKEQLILSDTIIHKAPKLQKGNCIINWNDTVNNIYNFIRGTSPYPGASAIINYNNKKYKIKIYKANKTNIIEENKNNGDLLYMNNHIYVKCDDYLLELELIQPESRKKMDPISFIHGLK